MARAIQLNTTTRAWMPLVGLGTFKVRGPDVHKSLDAALAAGCRSIDTASGYRNESEIAAALKELLPKYNCTREDLFITSKLGTKEQGPGCKDAVLRSLENLCTDYIDLYLIHWPGVQGMQPGDPKQAGLRRQSWEVMEDFYRQGKLRAIGVSNYNLNHMEELFSYCTVPPAVLQTEFHPHLQRPQLVDFCKSKCVHFQAYSSLGTSDPEGKLLNDEVVQKVAAECGKSPALVLLRWAVQQNIGVLPKSTSPGHIEENMKLFDFELSDNQMKALCDHDKDLHYAWDSAKIV